MTTKHGFRRVILILAVMLSTGALAGAAWFYLRPASFERPAETRLSTFVSVESGTPPVCTQSASSRECGDGALVVIVGSGSSKRYVYGSDVKIHPEGSSLVDVLKPGTKIEIDTLEGDGDRITSIRVLE